MSFMEYNKLVRDKIPAIIAAQGEKANIRILSDEEYTRCLEAKLDEEVREYHMDRNAEKLADILEVVFALAENQGVSVDNLTDIFNCKHQQRGGFRERFFLISKED